jgi:tRNA(Ile)-lysidine synthase
MEGRKKVKEIVMEARVERQSRCLVPIVEDSEILWVAGLRRCEGRRPKPGHPALCLHFQALQASLSAD